MKRSDKMSRAVSNLEHFYNSLNTDFFGGELPVPVITVQSKPGTYGHCSTSKIWRNAEDGAYELNIAAEMLDSPIEELIDTLIHEMIHLYCREHQISEVSRGGSYHNGRFKAEAEKRGLLCYRTEKYGWNTKASDKLLEYALEKGWTEIKIARCGFPTGHIGSAPLQGTSDGSKGDRRPSSTRKLLCPFCGQSVRATKHVNIICGNCMVQMTEA